MKENKRCAIESQIMDELQNDRREFARYYACDAIWVDRWLKYMQSPDGERKPPPPGPIDNRTIAKTLLKQRNEKDSEAAGTYFNLSKHLWLFFVSMWGGGPAVVANSKY